MAFIRGRLDTDLWENNGTETFVGLRAHRVPGSAGDRTGCYESLNVDDFAAENQRSDSLRMTISCNRNISFRAAYAGEGGSTGFC